MASVTFRKRLPVIMTAATVVADLVLLAPLLLYKINALTIIYLIISSVCLLGGCLVHYLRLLDYAHCKRDLITRQYPKRFYRMLDCFPKGCLYFLAMDLDDAEFLSLKKQYYCLILCLVVHFVTGVLLLHSVFPASGSV